MGIYNFGIPKDDAIFFKNFFRLTVFVETGTYQGHTAKSMSLIFEKVYTVEKSEEMFKVAQDNLKNIRNIKIYLGDSRKVLKEIIEKENNLLFWLDAHWSGEKTYGEGDECPTIEELKVIFEHTDKNMVIFIDDARLFMAPPPLPHNFTYWPQLRDILNAIPETYDVLIFKDVIYVYRKDYALEIRKYFQEKTTKEWREFGKQMEPKFKDGIKIIFKSFKNFINRKIKKPS